MKFKFLLQFCTGPTQDSKFLQGCIQDRSRVETLQPLLCHATSRENIHTSLSHSGVSTGKIFSHATRQLFISPTWNFEKQLVSTTCEDYYQCMLLSCSANHKSYLRTRIRISLYPTTAIWKSSPAPFRSNLEDGLGWVWAVKGSNSDTHRTNSESGFYKSIDISSLSALRWSGLGRVAEMSLSTTVPQIVNKNLS